MTRNTNSITDTYITSNGSDHKNVCKIDRSQLLAIHIVILILAKASKLMGVNEKAVILQKTIKKIFVDKIKTNSLRLYFS